MLDYKSRDILPNENEDSLCEIINSPAPPPKLKKTPHHRMIDNEINETGEIWPEDTTTNTKSNAFVKKSSFA